MPTSAQWLDLDGVGQRSDEFRIDILDASLTVQGTLAVVVDSGTVTNDIHRDIKRTLEFEPKPGALSGLNLLTARFRPVMVLPNGVEYNLGVFMSGDRSDQIRKSHTQASVTLVDQTLLVDQPHPEAVSLKAGGSAKAKIEELLAFSAITDFMVDVDFVPGSPMAWAPGTSRLAMINEMAGSAGGYSLFFNNDGTARIIAVPAADAATLTYARTLPRILAESIVRSDDALAAPNQYVVIGATGDANSDPVVGVYDVEDDAPHSFANRGYYVTETQTVNGLTTAVQCQARAHSWAKQQSNNYEWLFFESPADPRHDTFDVVSVDLDDGNGARIYREQGWALPLVSGGPMEHDLRRSYA